MFSKDKDEAHCLHNNDPADLSSDFWFSAICTLSSAIFLSVALSSSSWCSRALNKEKMDM